MARTNALSVRSCAAPPLPGFKTSRTTFRTLGGAMLMDFSWAEATVAAVRQKVKASKIPEIFFMVIVMVADLCGKLGWGELSWSVEGRKNLHHIPRCDVRRVGRRLAEG